MTMPTPHASTNISDFQRLELAVTNSHALRAGSSARHSFSHAGGTIGSRGSDWLLDDGQETVEAIHCEIAWIDNSYCVRDQSGATRINDATTPLRRGTTARLRDGDILHIGSFQVTAHLLAPGNIACDNRSQAQLDVGELLNEPTVTLQGSSDPIAPLDGVPRRTDLSAFDALEGQAQPTDALDPLAALDAAQHQPQDTLVSDTLDRTVYGLSAQSSTQPDHARTRHEAVYGSPKTLTGDSSMSQSFTRTLGSGDANALVQPLAEGLGASVGPVDACEGFALLLEAGKALGAMVRGIVALQTSAEGNRRYLAPLAGTLQPIEDNPLRLGLDYPSTVRALFSVERSLVHLSPSAAVEESLNQVRRHQIAMTRAIEAGLQALLRAFAPDQLRQRFERYQSAQSVHSEGPDWNWQMYTHYYNELSSSRQQGFEKLFWEVFGHAYDRALRQETQ